jgi:D-3-phosphoglycerate dehydrogenase
MYEVSPDIENPDAIIVRSAKLHDMVINPELLCIARAGSGVNNIPVDRCAEAGVTVFNTPGANAEAVKELVLSAMFLCSRDILGGIEWVRSISSKGEDVVALVEKQKSKFIGPEIYGKSLGVVGLGAIGAKVAAAASALGMKVYGYDPYISVEAAWKLPSEIIQAKELNDIYRNCDYITLHVPYMEQTHHFISKESISMMRTGVRVINISRAELVSDEDMLSALKSGHVSRYVTDFPNAKTADAQGVIAIPHLGASTPESEDNCVSMACTEIIEYIENGNIINSVNMPSAFMPRSNGDPRVCIIHDNVPEMIAKMTAAVSKLNVNIEHMMNVGKKGSAIAYSMLDVNTVPEGLVDALRSIKGIIRVRILV